MKSVNQRWSGFFVTILTILNGCGDSADNANWGDTKEGVATAVVTTTLTGDLATYCEEACKKLVSCEKEAYSIPYPDLESSKCKATCIETTQPLESKLTGAFVPEFTPCVQKKECRDLTNANGPALFVCVNEATLEVGSSAAVIQACDAMQEAYGRCKTKFDRTDCIAQAKLLTEDALESAVESCANAPCEENGVRKCIEASIGMSKYTSLENMESQIIQTSYRSSSGRSSGSSNAGSDCADIVMNSGAYDFAYICR